MHLETSYFPYTLHFSFDAGTSRGVLREKTSWFLKITAGDATGWGEAGPLPGLSPETNADVEKAFKEFQGKLPQFTSPDSEEECLSIAVQLTSEDCPSARFALETALLDLYHGGRQEIIPSGFYESGERIPINGLIWMGDPEFMREQFDAKRKQGFSCFKMKVGALDFEKELQTLTYIRQLSNDILRVDANGAFDANNVHDRLTALSAYGLHSIEQPVAPGQWDLMASLCNDPIIDIALDEELIGIHGITERRRLLEVIKPQYIILKPTLLGGIASTRQWVELADEYGIGWWMTSALESNIGLNAICQLTSSLEYDGHQGLGTGQLYVDNIPSPLMVSNGEIRYYAPSQWDFPKSDQ